MPSDLFIKDQINTVEEILRSGVEQKDVRGYSIYNHNINVLHLHRPSGEGTITSAFLGTIYSNPVEVFPETLAHIAELLNEEVV